MDVQGLRDFVRLQLDVDEEELPDALLNVYLQVAFDHTMAFNNRWPRYETTWSLTKAAGSDSVPVPADLNLPSVVSVVSVANPSVVLQVVAQENAEQMFISSSIVATGTPAFVSVWGGAFHLWPRYSTDSEYSFTVRGYRQPVWSNSASDIPDLDERLHPSMCWYAIALAYAQQEDEVLEAIYMARWEREMAQQMKAILDPVRNSPVIMGGGMQPLGGSGWVINPPAGP